MTPITPIPSAATEHYASCVQRCYACALACDQCAFACLNEADTKPLVRCIALDVDCAAACRLAAGYVSRQSPASVAVCEFCAEVCDLCAEECLVHAEKHAHCKACAEACYQCAEDCRRMAGLLSGAKTAAL